MTPDNFPVPADFEDVARDTYEPYLVWASAGAGAAMTLLYLLAADASLAVMVVPLLAYLIAFLVARFSGDAGARQQLGIVVFTTVILTIVGSAFLLPYMWGVVTIVLAFSALAAQDPRLGVYAGASLLGVLFAVWPQPYTFAAPGVSIGALAPLIGGAAVLVARKVLGSR